MKTRHVCILLLTAMTLGGCGMMHKGSEGDAVKVPMEQVPAAVKATFAREAPGATITVVDMEKDEGQTTYEADATIAGKNYEIKVSPDGALISKKLDNEADEKAGADKKQETGEHKD